MKRSKLESYLGFAARAGKVVTGSNPCLTMIPRRKVLLVIISEDVGENTREKLSQKCASHGVEYRIYGKAEMLSAMTGKTDKGIFGITDKGFAESIRKEIDLIQSEMEVTDGEKSI